MPIISEYTLSFISSIVSNVTLLATIGAIYIAYRIPLKINMDNIKNKILDELL